MLDSMQEFHEVGNSRLRTGPSGMETRLDQEPHDADSPLKRLGTHVFRGGEFGRTVFCQGKLTKTNFGREHHHLGFTTWMAGAGVKPGFTHGRTDK